MSKLRWLKLCSLPFASVKRSRGPDFSVPFVVVFLNPVCCFHIDSQPSVALTNKS